MQVTLDTAAIAGTLGAACGVIATAVGMSLRVIRPLRKALARFSQFAEDWEGEPERPGVPGRDGVMVRLRNIERNQDDHIASHNTVIVASLSSSSVNEGHRT